MCVSQKQGDNLNVGVRVRENCTGVVPRQHNNISIGRRISYRRLNRLERQSVGERTGSIIPVRRIHEVAVGTDDRNGYGAGHLPAPILSSRLSSAMDKYFFMTTSFKPSVSITDNTFTNSAGVGSTVEAFCGDDANLCLDLERNTNDDEYRFAALTGGTAVYQIEQRDVLTDPEPTGAGNTGNVVIVTGPGFFTPSDVADGTCGF